MSWMLLIAWTLPIAAGTATWLAINPQRTPGWRSNALGHGIVFGMMMAAGATALFAGNDIAHAVRNGGAALVCLLLIAAIIARKRGKKAWLSTTQGSPAAPTSRWLRVFLGIAMASLLWRAWIALREILLRPTFPWDAWDAWAVKSKAWFLLGHYVPFVPIRDWIAHATPDSFTGIAWSYPGTLGWIQVWFASAADGWIEPAVNLPWLALWVGLVLAHFGQWRALGLSTTRALLGVYFLASLPLITVHVALAGYADLWVATLFAFAVLAWLRWTMQRDRGQLFVFVVAVLLLPLLKLEGAVWLLFFVVAAVLSELPPRAKKMALAVCAVVILLGLAFGKLALPLLTLGWVHVAPHTIEVPVLGPLAIAWHSGALSGTLQSLFAQPNWNLLWWLTPVVLVWRWRVLRSDYALRAIAWLLLVCTGFLLFLFLLTDAARFAESFTAINRLVMHIVPALITLLALLLRDATFPPARVDTAHASAARKPAA